MYLTGTPDLLRLENDWSYLSIVLTSILVINGTFLE